MTTRHHILLVGIADGLRFTDSRLPRWMHLESEHLSDDRKSLVLVIRLKWWRWIDPTFWWAALRGPRP